MLDTVLRVLEAEGYQQKAVPIRVADMPFPFDAVLIGPRDQGTLVIAAVADGRGISQLKRHVRSLLLVLEREESSRPISLVVVTRQPRGRWTEELEQLCRLFVLDAAANEQAVKAQLVQLLPLKLPKPIGRMDRAESMLEAALGSEKDSGLYRDVLQAAHKGAKAVEEVLLSKIDEAATLVEHGAGS